MEQKVNLILSIIQTVAVIIASVIAVSGIKSWRREAKWKRKFEVAEEALALFYECQEKFNIIRSAAGNTMEGKSRPRSANESPEQTATLDEIYIPYERYERERKCFDMLFSLKFRFITQFGAESAAPFEDFGRILNEIFWASRRRHEDRLGLQKGYQLSEPQLEKTNKALRKFDSIIYNDDGSDELSLRIKQNVKVIETYCAGVIRKR